MRRWPFILTALILTLSQGAVAELALENATAEYLELPREYRLDGVVEAVKQATVSAQTQGRVEEILFDVDDFVEKGSLIVRLRDTEQKARLIRAQANLKEVDARLQNARKEYSRIKGIFEKRLISRAAMDKADTTLKAAKARQDAARAGLAQAKEQFGYTLVRAPYSGIVTHRYVELGEVASPGQPLMRGLSLDQLRVSVDVPQSLIPAVRRIGTARVQLPGKHYIPAEKVTIFPFAHHGSNTFKVRLDLPKGVKQLFPGMFVKTAFVVGSHRQLLIPQSAVVYRGEVTGTYVITPGGLVSLRHIRVGHRTGDDMMEILSGLDEGEKVALYPINAGVLLKRQQAEQDRD